MKIIIVDSSIAFTGAFKCAVSEAELLSPQHTFVFVLPARSVLKPYLEEKGFKVYMLPMVEIGKSSSVLLKYFPALFKNARALNKIVKAEEADVVQINDFYNMLGVMMRRLGFRGKLITYVRFLPSSRPKPLMKIWSYMAQKYSDNVVTVSDVALRELPPHPKNIRIFDPVKLEEQLPAKEYGDNGETIDILYQGNYIRGKGQDAGLEAFALAYKQNPRLRIKFAGGDMGLEKNRLFKQQLENRVAELGLQDVVTFTAFAKTVEEGMKEADIVLNFSESESFSMVCLEASFYGTALIATRCGGPEEIIIDGETGFLVPLHDYAAAGEAILKLCDPELRKRFALAAKKTVRERFPVENFIKEFEEVLSSK
ncbi:MAG: glycosyltransferase family 4 protein [Flavipsychrobacter sp.]